MNTTVEQPVDVVTPNAPINSEESELGLEGFDFEEFEHDLVNLVADDPEFNLPGNATLINLTTKSYSG